MVIPAQKMKLSKLVSGKCGACDKKAALSRSMIIPSPAEKMFRFALLPFKIVSAMLGIVELLILCGSKSKCSANMVSV